MRIEKVKGLVTTGRKNESDFELLVTTKEDKYPTKNTSYTSAVFEGDIIVHYNNGLVSSIEIRSLIPKQSTE